MTDGRTAGTGEQRSEESDRAAVSERLGRDPAGEFEVVVRSGDGAPAVIANAPFLDDGTPMPTRYWLVDPDLRDAVSRLESTGGVRQAEAAVPPEQVAEAHARYAAERDALIDPARPRPETLGWRGRDPPGGQVPARPSGLVADRGRRSGRVAGRRNESGSIRPERRCIGTAPDWWWLRRVVRAV